MAKELRFGAEARNMLPASGGKLAEPVRSASDYPRPAGQVTDRSLMAVRRWQETRH